MAAVIIPWHGDLWPSIRGFTGLSVEKQLEMSNWWPFKEKNLHSATEGPRLPACALAVWSVIPWETGYFSTNYTSICFIFI